MEEIVLLFNNYKIAFICYYFSKTEIRVKNEHSEKFPLAIFRKNWINNKEWLVFLN